MNLTRPQVLVLRQLIKNGPSKTSTSTDGKYIAGTVAAALMRRKLAHGRFHYVDLSQPGRHILEDYRVEITELGRATLAEHDRLAMEKI